MTRLMMKYSLPQKLSNISRQVLSRAPKFSEAGIRGSCLAIPINSVICYRRVFDAEGIEATTSYQANSDRDRKFHSQIDDLGLNTSVYARSLMQLAKSLTARELAYGRKLYHLAQASSPRILFGQDLWTAIERWSRKDQHWPTFLLNLRLRKEHRTVPAGSVNPDPSSSAPQ